MEALKKASERRRSRAVPNEEGEGGDDEEDDNIETREEGRERWEDVMTRRFLEGEDEDIDYTTIDDNEEYDDRKQMERDEEDAYFDAESPSLLEGSTDTGIQDF